MRFEWDEAKNRENRRKHRVSFEEVSSLFSRGDDYLVIFDEAHSEDEDRLIAIGPILQKLVVVIFTEREEDTIRIISARKATKREAQLYRSYVEDQLP